MEGSLVLVGEVGDVSDLVDLVLDAVVESRFFFVEALVLDPASFPLGT